MSFSLRLLGRTAAVLPRGARGWLRSASSWGKFAGGFQQESGESTAGGGSRRWGAFLLGVAASGGVGLLAYQRRHRESGGEGSLLVVLPELQAAEEKSELSRQERRKQLFKLHSSYMYKGEPYMTPRDFLESLTQDDLRSECCINYAHQKKMYEFSFYPPPDGIPQLVNMNF